MPMTCPFTRKRDKNRTAEPEAEGCRTRSGPILIHNNLFQAAARVFYFQRTAAPSVRHTPCVSAIVTPHY